MTKGLAKKRFDDGLTKEYVFEWFNQIEDGKLPPATKSIGWLKIAFCLAFQCLRLAFMQEKTLSKDFYDTCMTSVLSKGGDTDTNAAIVGGLIGALVGLRKGIPADWVKGLLKFDC